MKKFILTFLLLWTSVAHAQFNGCPAGFCIPSSGPTYTGPGDITPYSFWYGLRAYNNAKAVANAPVADLVASTGGAAVCTLKLATNGDADLTSSYCAGTNVPAACAAASGGTCKITKLYDQAGACPVSQATLAAMPVLAFNVIGTKPSILFAAASSQVMTGTCSGSISQPLTISYVARRPALVGSSNSLFSGGSGGGGQVAAGFQATNNAFAYAPTNNVAFASDASFHAIQFVANGGSSNIYVDGTSNVVGAGASALSTTQIWFGSDTFGNFMNGYVGEAAVAASGFSVTAGGTASLMNTNQHNYWGF